MTLSLNIRILAGLALIFGVAAAIMMIGIIGLLSDMILAKIGKHIFPWEKAANKA